LLCAVFVFVIESGRLDDFAATWLRPFAVSQPEGALEIRAVPSFDQSLGLPALPAEFLEPNPVSLTPDDSPDTIKPTSPVESETADPSQPPEN
jgi:hypothetical protein